MKIFPVGLGIASIFLCTNLCAALPEGGGTAESLAAAEKAFAAESVAKDMRTAFLDVLSNDGVVFDPGPGAQNGKQVWLAKKGSDAILEWQPVLAVVASSGDVGYTTGPWNFRKAPNEKASAFGEFVSVWRREGTDWKLLCDVGSDHPQPSSPTAELKLVDLPHPNESKPEQFAHLQQLDGDFAKARAAHFLDFADEDVRLYLPGKFPVLGKSAAAASLVADSTTISFGTSKGGISQSGDLGFLWGEYRVGSAATATGDYLRIWRKDDHSAWKLVLDLLHPR